MIQVLSSIVKNVSWELNDPSHKPIEVADITLGAKHGMYLKVKRRQKV